MRTYIFTERERIAAANLIDPKIIRARAPAEALKDLRYLLRHKGPALIEDINLLLSALGAVGMEVKTQIRFDGHRETHIVGEVSGGKIRYGYEVCRSVILSAKAPAKGPNAAWKLWNMTPIKDQGDS